MRAPMALTAILLSACTAAYAEVPTTFTLLNRTATAYARLDSYTATSSLTRRVLGKDETASVTMALHRPDRMRIEVKGPRTPIVVAVNGRTTVACRSDRNVYTRFEATPKQSLPDVLARPDFPAPASRIVALYFRNAVRTPSSPLAKGLAEATVGGPATVADANCWTLTFPYDTDRTATVYVGQDDWMVRRVALAKRGVTLATETIDKIEKDQPVDDASLAYELPKRARLVADLPAFPNLKPDAPPALADAHDFTLMSTSGENVTLSKLRGKPVMLVFYIANSEENQNLFPLLVDIHKRNKDRPGEIYAIDSAASSADDTAAYIKGFGAGITGLLNGTTDDAVEFFKIDAFPTIVYVNADGKIADTVTGYDKKAINAGLLKIGLE